MILVSSEVNYYKRLYLKLQAPGVGLKVGMGNEEIKNEETRKFVQCVQHLTTEREDQWPWFMGSFCPHTLPVHTAGWQVVCPVIASLLCTCSLSWLKKPFIPSIPSCLKATVLLTKKPLRIDNGLWLTRSE